MKKVFILFAFIPFLIAQINAQTNQKQRLIVLTDIEADPDDSQSLVRLLLYSNQIEIEGLIATTSIHQKARVAPETIHSILGAYEKVQPNLLKHETGFPAASDLHKIVKQGLPVFGMNGVGKGKDSEGSEWIIKVLEKDDNRPVWISVWGGPNTLAQALWKIKERKSKREAKRLISKLKVYTISDQDDTGIWIRKNFPELFYIVSIGNYWDATWNAINSVIDGANNEVISNNWLAKNIQQGHGPLGAQYPDVAYGMEGDTPAWLMLIQNGLNNEANPNWGSWGGRYELYIPEPLKEPIIPVFIGGAEYEPESRPIWTNADDTFTPRLPNKYGRAIRKDTATYTNNKVTLWRWREDFQNDFAARMDWCTSSFEEANHPPVPALGHPDKITVKSGEIFSLDASGTTDPDGDNLSYWWFQYPEAGSYSKTISFDPYSENLYNLHTIVAPEVEKTETAHFILKVTDKGTPALSRYKRVIVTILPN
ncbi:nucleoside hydrolase-like domain-containing protein [uncultured Draconibacterium sp.]|uniref:nucleoside hydrolase-like domain-containing protein n=1 Tax=uncultured Draconibacterium sp. TaxID=1573823 RepID=UPI0032171A1D